jgi:hypothetical protein
VGAGLVEGSIAGGEWSFAGVLGDDEGIRGEELAASGAAEEVQGRFVLDLEVVGRVEEEDVDGAGWGLDGLAEAVEKGSGAAVFEGVALGDLEGREIRAEGGDGGGGLLGEPDVESAAADGLDADGAGAGVEIDEAAAFNTRGEDVEEGLAEAVAGGAGFGATGRDELTGTVGAGDDAHSLDDNLSCRTGALGGRRPLRGGCWALRSTSSGS